MEELLQGLVDGINVLIDGFGNFVNDLIYITDLTSAFVVRIPSYLAWLPDTIVSVFVVGFGIVVVYKILGREG